MTTHKAVVVEVFSHNPAQDVVTARYQGVTEEYIFMLIPQHPAVSFGDILEVVNKDGNQDGVYLSRGNSKLRYRLLPVQLPTQVLRQLIEDRLE